MSEKKNAGIGDNAEIRTNLGNRRQFIWARNGFDSSNDICKESLMKLELPLIDNGNKMLGTLWLVKDLNADAISHYTLRRVEHLRRTIVGTLEKMKREKVSPSLTLTDWGTVEQDVRAEHS